MEQITYVIGFNRLGKISLFKVRGAIATEWVSYTPAPYPMYRRLLGVKGASKFGLIMTARNVIYG